MSAVGSPTSRSTPTYVSLFNDVHRKRLHYVNRVIVLAAFVVSALWKLPYPNVRWDFTPLLYQVPLLCVSLLMVKFCRISNSVVDYLRARTFAEQIASSVTSRLFFITCAYSLLSALIFYGTFLLQLPLMGQYFLLSKEFRKRPPVNDQWVYFWFHGATCALGYAFQQVVFQRTRLRFKYGISSIKPSSALFSTMPTILGHSIAFTLFTSLGSPFIYYWVRPMIYRLNWATLSLLSLDPSMPPYNVGARNLLSVTIATFFLFLVWESVNHVYDTYATIGCLDGKKLISRKSAAPLESLLLGLCDVTLPNQPARLTAFQELAYIASDKSAESITMRKVIYSSSGINSSIWLALLDECSLVINEASLRINYRSKADLDALKTLDLYVKDVSGSSARKDSLIFGNSFVIAPEDQSGRSKTKDEQVNGNLQTKEVEHGCIPSSTSCFPSSACIKRHLTAFMYSNSSDPLKLFRLNSFGKWIKVQEQRVLDSKAGMLFRITLKRDGELRVVNPVNVGNAVISLSGLVLHAVEEDRQNTISDHIVSDVFNLLERLIRSCSNYIDVVPSSVYLTESQQKSAEVKSHLLIAVLHDVAMREYVNLCVKYNYKLNDLLLSAKAFKLAKWVIDASIAQQLQRNKQQMSKII